MALLASSERVNAPVVNIVVFIISSCGLNTDSPWRSRSGAK
jgi:hypothetical protein